MPEEDGRISVNVEGKREYVPRTMRTTMKDLEKFVSSVGCAGCRAANCGSTSMGHTEERRRRIM